MMKAILWSGLVSLTLASPETDFLTAQRNKVDNAFETLSSKPSPTHIQALVPVAGANMAIVGHPLSVASSPRFLSVYEENNELWNDLSVDDARINYMRSSTGQVDSAALLMEFSLLPSLQDGLSSDSEAAKEANPFHAVVTGNIEKVKSSSALALATTEDRGDGLTTLHAAAAMGNTELIQILVQKARDHDEDSFDIDETNLAGLTALMIAASLGHVEAVTELVNLGANINFAHAFAQSTALHFATELGRPEVITALCTLGADVQAKKLHGGTVRNNPNNPYNPPFNNLVISLLITKPREIR